MLAAVLVFVQADFEDFCCEFPGRESCSWSKCPYVVSLRGYVFCCCPQWWPPLTF